MAPGVTASLSLSSRYRAMPKHTIWYSQASNKLIVFPPISLYLCVVDRCLYCHSWIDESSTSNVKSSGYRVLFCWGMGNSREKTGTYGRVPLNKIFKITKGLSVLLNSAMPPKKKILEMQ